MSSARAFPKGFISGLMAVAMESDGLSCAREFPIQVMLRGQLVGRFALDLVIESKVILELKALEVLSAAHTQPNVAYLTASGLPIGLLINFGAERLQYKRLSPPQAVQSSSAFQDRQS